MNTKISSAELLRAIETATEPRQTDLQVTPKQILEYIGSVGYKTNERVLADIKKRLYRNTEGEMYLRVTSTGGASGAGMSFYDTVRHVLKPELHTIGSGDVDSSGIIIFLSGKKRYIARHTTLLLHLAGRRFDSGVRYTAVEMEAMLQEDKIKDLQYASIVAENSYALTPADVLTMMETNTVLTPEKLLALGLAHAILG